MHAMSLELIAATRDDLPVVRSLSSYYIYDMSEQMGWRCPESGQFGGCDEFFGDWEAGRNAPFVIRADGELAGFAGVKYNEEAQEHSIQEFFILRKFRRTGIGRETARRLFARFPGIWCVEMLCANAPAVAFWRAVTGAYAGEGGVAAEQHDSPWGPMVSLRFVIC